MGRTRGSRNNRNDETMASASTSMVEDADTTVNLSVDEPLLDEDNLPLAIAALKYVLNAAGSKIPVKKVDIVKLCLNGNNNKQLFLEVMFIVEKWLNEVRMWPWAVVVTVVCI